MGSPITAMMKSTAFPPLPPRPGSAGLPLPAMSIHIVDDNGRSVNQGEMGNVVLCQPLAPSALTTLWANEERYQEWVFIL